MSCDTFSSLEAITVKLYMLLKTGEAHLLGTTYLPLQKDCSPSLTPLNTMHLSLNSMKLHNTSSHSRRLKTVDRRYSTTFGSVYKILHSIH